MQFIKCLLGFHKWVGIGYISGAFKVTDKGDAIYADGCSYCGTVKLLYIRDYRLDYQNLRIK
jgi:hypothetical protein